ncbi:hypothetical protein [Streptomyces colonosanans]|uniref:Uncharacterized protein n=1 Tax=Streptomyces colonosanans TaxID=1428652 RepID=A0A1S2NYS4_9ACTN|nr:hypothetical protein [Streptomyces colonosanans]OIJ86416.1 hypothetical protein BIV24_26525 [Streptomyces colonosanans]
MEPEPPLFQILVNQKGWQEYDVFKRRYQEAARELADLEGPSSLATAPPPEKRQFVRWVRGEVKTAPRSEARRVLQFMFPGIPLGRLFAPASTAGTSPDLRGPTESSLEGQLDYGAEDVVMAAANESARFAARAESSNVGPHTMEQLEADIRRIVTTYPNRPVGPLFSEVRALRDRAFEFLEGRQPPQYTRDLYVAAGVLCGVLANASFDLGRYDAAETQARTAFMCGELAGHNGLRAWVRGLQALIAYWDGRPHDAVRLSEAGGNFTPEYGTAHIRLASIKARAYGQLQQASDAIAALNSADNMRNGMIAGDDLPGGMMAFPEEKQLFYASSTHLWLGGDQHLSDAEARADEAVCMFEAAPPESRRLGEMSLARMDLAMARMNRGDLDGAALQVYDVLGVNARRRTESVRKRLGQFGRHLALHPARSTPAAIAMREAIVAHQEQIPAELPPGVTQ